MVVPKDCPRCASINVEDDRSCWLCGWDFTNGSKICDKCGLEIKAGKNCILCEEWKIDEE